MTLGSSAPSWASEVRPNVLLLFGEPGVGKSVLLDVIAQAGTAAGIRILRASGLEFEANVSFAGLNQLVGGLSDEIERLPPNARDTLRVIQGERDDPARDHLAVATATLELLRQAANAQPILLLVDDLPWF